jgi:membrane protease YdiL (CAAX protease family)
MTGKHSSNTTGRQSKANSTRMRKADLDTPGNRQATQQVTHKPELSEHSVNRIDRKMKPAQRRQEKKNAGEESHNPTESSAGRFTRPDVMWNWFDLILISVTLIVAFFVSSNVMRSALAQLLPGAGQATLRLVLVLVFYVIEILVVVYIAHRHNYGFAKLYRLQVAQKDDLETPLQWVGGVCFSGTLVLALLVITRGVGMLWSYFTGLINWTPSSSSDLLTMFGTSSTSIVLAMICVVILAPFIEEIIFRGVFLSTFEKVLPPWVSVVVTSAIFAVYHASLWALIPHFVLALALGYLAVERKTLWPAILLHALYNATLMAAAFYLSL